MRIDGMVRGVLNTGFTALSKVVKDISNPNDINGWNIYMPNGDIMELTFKDNNMIFSFKHYWLSGMDGAFQTENLKINYDELKGMTAQELNDKLIIEFMNDGFKEAV